MIPLTRRDALMMAAGAALVAGNAWSADSWIEGKHYFKIESPQPSAKRGTVTVTEIFSYGCPGCNAFLPYMQSLEKQLPTQVIVDYLHASWYPSENWPVFQRAYLTARTLGVSKQAHQAMFAAIWQTGELAVTDARTGRAKSPLPSIEDVARFYQRVCAVPAAKFLETARSFSIDTQMRRSDVLIQTLRPDSTPTLIVNGKYRTDPPSVGNYLKTVELALWLVEKERRA
jgi:thiol:disulfide interchange protein DsbA